MKLRVRFQNTKQSIDVGDDVKTINDLKHLISNLIHGLPDGFRLSLNGSSAVCDGGGDQLLADAGIVSGDLLHVVPTDRSGISRVPPTLAADDKRQKTPSSDAMIRTESNSEETSMELDQQDNNEFHPPTADEYFAQPSKGYNNKEEEEEEEDVDISMVCSLSLVASKFPKLLPHERQRLLVVVLNCIMSELGFRLDDSNQEPENEDFDPYAILLTFIHPTFEGTTFQLFLVTMMDLCKLHCMCWSGGKIEGKESMDINPVQLLDGISCDEDLCRKKKFEGKLFVLRRAFRDRIGNNTRQCALRLHGFPEMAELSTLPYEVQMKLLDYLDVPSILRLSETSTFWWSVCTEQSVWRRKYHQLADGKNERTISGAWLELYKKTYKEQKEKSKRSHHHHHHHHHQPFPFPLPHHHHPCPGYFQPHPSHRSFPGVIGGDWDVNPGGIGSGMFGPNSEFFGIRNPDPSRAFNPPVMPGIIRPGLGGGLNMGGNLFGGHGNARDHRGIHRHQGHFHWHP